MSSEEYEPCKYWDPFVERGDPPDEGLARDKERA